MTKERLIEMIDSVLAWGTDHDEEFRSCLVDALDITDEEYKELFDEDLGAYLGEEDDEDDDSYSYDDAIAYIESKGISCDPAGSAEGEYVCDLLDNEYDGWNNRSDDAYYYKQTLDDIIERTKDYLKELKEEDE